MPEMNLKKCVYRDLTLTTVSIFSQVQVNFLNPLSYFFSFQFNGSWETWRYITATYWV